MLAYDSDPQRDVERVERAVAWLREAEAAMGDLATLTRISRELRSTLSTDCFDDPATPGRIAGISITCREQFSSWNGYAWTSAGDIRRVVMADLESRGLTAMFEQREGGVQ